MEFSINKVSEFKKKGLILVYLEHQTGVFLEKKSHLTSETNTLRVNEKQKFCLVPKLCLIIFIMQK